MSIEGLQAGDLFIIGEDLDQPKLKIQDGYVELRDEMAVSDDDIPDGELTKLTPTVVANHLGMSLFELNKLIARYMQPDVDAVNGQTETDSL